MNVGEDVHICKAKVKKGARVSSNPSQTSAVSTDNGEVWLSGHDLFCERDDRVLFSGLNFELSPTNLVRIVGPNGAGKSTLMRILVGMSAGYEGDVRWKGEDLHRARYDFHSNLLYLGHQVGVKGNLTPEENLNWLVPEASGDEIFDALERVKLRGYEDVLTQGLSAGQQRRVALARLFIEKKPVWILDEPFTAIDKYGVAELEQILVDKAASGGLVIVTTHHELAVEHKTIELGGQ